MLTLDWFTARIGEKVVVEHDGNAQVLVISKGLAPWLHASQQYGYTYSPHINQPNVCIACEG